MSSNMSGAVLQELLGALSTAFRARDIEGLMQLFSVSKMVTYAGSEVGEKATGPSGLRSLLTELLARPLAYSFKFPDVTFSEHTRFVWLIADGDGTETGDDGGSATFPYRITGVLAREGEQWRWLVLVGSEPSAG
jgi:hypothetical protein